MTVTRALAVVPLLLIALPAAGDPPKPDAEADEKAARLDHMKKAAKGYEITLASDTEKKLALGEEPVLRFNDNVTGVVDGAVFLWTFEDRPAAAASVWIRKSGHEFHEFQSLATVGLECSNQGQRRWAPEQPGIERKPASFPKPPTPTAAGRLQQMRAFAGEFTAVVSTSEKDRQEVRLLPQPIYRYGRADGTVVDGALFAYCKGTNPEVVLLVEAVKNGAELEWHHAFARMTSRACEVRRGEKVVWTTARAQRELPTDPYFNVVQRYTGPGAKTEPPPP